MYLWNIKVAWLFKNDIPEKGAIYEKDKRPFSFIDHFVEEGYLQLLTNTVL